MQKVEEPVTNTSKADVSSLISQYKDNPQVLMRILLKTQEKSQNSLPQEVIQQVSQETGIPAAKLYGFVEFYAMFSEDPRGKHIIRVCDSGPCHVRGSRDAAAEVLKQLNLTEPGQTSLHATFTVEMCECLGCCDSAPNAIADDRIFGHLNAISIEDMILQLRGEGD